MYNYRKLDRLPVLNLFINFYFYLHREHVYRLSIYVFYISSMNRNKSSQKSPLILSIRVFSLILLC